VKSAFRERERITFTTLDAVDIDAIGMLTTMIIGNSHTFLSRGRMITPRGYERKYDIEASTTEKIVRR